MNRKDNELTCRMLMATTLEAVKYPRQIFIPHVDAGYFNRLLFWGVVWSAVIAAGGSYLLLQLGW